VSGVAKGPLIGTIIKPSVGLTPAKTAAQVKPLSDAGTDFIKDDELMGNSPQSPFDERVEAVVRVIKIMLMLMLMLMLNGQVSACCLPSI